MIEIDQPTPRLLPARPLNTRPSPSSDSGKSLVLPTGLVSPHSPLVMRRFPSSLPPMPAPFTRYLPPVPGAEPWGIAVTAGGASRTPRGAAYPPGRHPADHHLTWDHGRVLGAWQIVLIARGHGRFESAATGLQPLATGTALILFPGTWHRYAPDPATGWDELWIELHGPTLARLVATGVLAPERAVVPLRAPTTLARLLRAIHARLRSPTAGFDAISAGLALQALGLLHETARPAPANTPIDRAIDAAEQALAADLGAPCPIPDLAATSVSPSPTSAALSKPAPASPPSTTAAACASTAPAASSAPPTSPSKSSPKTSASAPPSTSPPPSNAPSAKAPAPGANTTSPPANHLSRGLFPTAFPFVSIRVPSWLKILLLRGRFLSFFRLFAAYPPPAHPW